jgi:alkanesulfonate monooxygenase SsuD/methylene tetrahydromethanopterin reductase-like flavin-dependent oxidoreductase (luciferase family)
MLSVARAAEDAELDAVWASEFYTHSATVALAAMTYATERLRLGSSIMYGVGRSPLVLATELRDLDQLSGGRIVAGLGNGTKRMISDWHGWDPDAPAVRMEELVPLLRQIWRLHEGPVRHEGCFYRMNLVPTAPVSAPLRTEIPVMLAAVRPRMCEAAGRVADGLAGHPLFTVKYVQEVVRPAIARGAARGERDPAGCELLGMVISVIHEDREHARREAAAQLAFYSSVKTYDQVLDAFSARASRSARRSRAATWRRCTRWSPTRCSTRWPSSARRPRRSATGCGASRASSTT